MKFFNNYYIQKKGKIHPKHVFEFLLEVLENSHDNISIIQIGANDGVSFDPIHNFIRRNKPRISGILVEPVDTYFSQLKTTYKGFPQLKLLNIAIHKDKKEAILHLPNPSLVGHHPKQKHLKGIASFNIDHHSISKTDSSSIIQKKVNCINFNDLVNNHRIDKIDLLQVDTEGYDSEIIMHIDFHKLKPRIINFEHGLRYGLMTKQTFEKVAEKLHENNYELWLQKNDCTAYQRNLLVDL